MSDLDEEELKATRILNGVDKKYKKISEEQAIKELTEIKELVEEDLKYKDYEVTAILDQIDLESLVIVLNLIEKQQKEIEELKNEVMEKELIIDGIKENRRIAVEEIQEQYYVSKDKIKAKIKELEREKEKYFEKQVIQHEIEVLQSLLEKE